MEAATGARSQKGEGLRLLQTRGLRLVVLGDVLELKSHLLAEGGDDGDNKLLAVLEGLLEVLAELVLRDLDVVLGVAVVVHEVEESERKRGRTRLVRATGVKVGEKERERTRRRC